MTSFLAYIKDCVPRLLFRLFKGKHKQNSEFNSFMKQEERQYLHYNHKCKFCIFDFGMFWLIFIQRRPEMRQQLRGLFCTGGQVAVRLPVCFNVLGCFFLEGVHCWISTMALTSLVVLCTSFTVCVNCGSQGANREREQRESSTWWDWYMMVSCST